MRKLTDEEREQESGYVIAMTALLLVPMLVLAAFAVDVGSWYTDAVRVQRAADAAALAAVVYMPVQVDAHEKALEVAAQNGFISDVDELGNPVAGGNSTLRFFGDGNNVRIEIDVKGELYFSQAFLNDVDITRTASAEYVEPVRMGNPTSGLGTGNLTNFSDVGAQGADGFWLALNHPCWSMENGDPFVAYYDPPNGTVPSNMCSSSGVTPIPQGSLNPPQGAAFDGYVFVIDMPGGGSGAQLEIRNAGDCPDDNRSAQPNLTTFVYGPDNTLNIASDNLAQPPVAGGVKTWDANTTSASGTCGWQNIYSVPSATGRRLWYLKVRADLNPNNSAARGLNPFSLRIRPNSTAGLCNSTVTATCPNIYALEWLPIYRPTFGTTQVAEFFLSEVAEFHEGKTLELNLFDPGEGMQEMQILHPDGTAMDFEYRIADTSLFGLGGPGLGDTAWSGADTGCAGSATRCLIVLGANWNGSQWTAPYPYNGRLVQIRVDLTGYTCQTLPAGDNCWWKVRYIAQSGGGVTDRTTWKTRIIGDPIRLTE